ncbi:NAD(+) diphosphatase [Porticoccus sp. GXU_MW_L64]
MTTTKPATCFLLVCEKHIIAPACSSGRPLWSTADARPWVLQQEKQITVGEYQGQHCHAIELSEPVAEKMVAAGAELLPLRSLLEQGEALFALAGRAVQLLDSYKEHRYCGRCGSKTRQLDGEHAMHCERCQHSCYPRLSPCAIMLVTRGDQCLLARHGGRGDYFTCLAGYVEPGEQVEQTVCREVQEEVGVSVSGLRYFSSQYWPFPGQLMLGFYAEYDHGDITPDGIEIVEADWFHYSDLPPHPNQHTLSGQLIRGFVSRCSK